MGFQLQGKGEVGPTHAEKARPATWKDIFALMVPGVFSVASIICQVSGVPAEVTVCLYEDKSRVARNGLCPQASTHLHSKYIFDLMGMKLSNSQDSLTLSRHILRLAKILPVNIWPPLLHVGGNAHQATACLTVQNGLLILQSFFSAQGYGLQYISASLSMMLSGSCIIFTAIASVWLLKRRLNRLHLSGCPTPKPSPFTHASHHRPYHRH